MIKTTLLSLSKISTVGFLTGSVYMASAIVSPLKTEKPRQETQLPSMVMSFTEMTPSWAAFEDDYYVGDYEEETIPQNLTATKLVPGQFELVPEQKFMAISLPQMSVAPLQPVGDTSPVKSLAPSALPLPQAGGASLVLNERFPHFWISGKLELAGGLAVSNPRDEIRLGWIVDGEVIRTGKIHIQDGTYEIKVDHLEGELIAELVDHGGFTKGEAILDLEQLTSRATSIEIKPVDIRIEPYQYGFSGKSVAIYETDKNANTKGVVTARVGKHNLYYKSDEKGRFEEESVSKHSTAMMTASRSQFRDTLFLADFEKKQNIRMFPENYLKALFDTLKMDNKFRDLGMVWGVINKSNSPAAGYTVRIADHPEAQPIYFNMYIALKDQPATSADGQYVFVGLEDGEYEVEVIDSVNQKVDSKLVSVKAGFVSQAEFEVEKKKTVAIRPFDPLSSTIRPIQLATMGSEAVHEIKTEEILKIPVLDGTDPFLVYAKPLLSQVETSVFASRGRKFLDIPVLNDDWWEKVRSKYNIQIQNGVVVGFVDTEAPFEVFVEETNPQMKVLYFNHSGDIIMEGQSQLPNGFVIYGLGDGLKTLILQSEAGWISTEITYITKDAVSLMYKAL